jgi:hypothetical protein
MVQNISGFTKLSFQSKLQLQHVQEQSITNANATA